MSTRMRGLWGCIAVSCLVAALGCGGNGEQTFRGTGPSLTPPFTVEDHWRVAWEFSGQVLRITVFDDQGDRVGTASQQGTGVGAARFDAGGRYSLEIQTEDTGFWTIRVAQAP